MMTDKREAYTLFELIAVLTISGIIFLVVMGSYNSWSTTHACNGAANILKAQIRQAKVLAMSQNRYTGLSLASYVTNGVRQVNLCQLYVCTNDNDKTDSLLEPEKSETFDEQFQAFQNIQDTLIPVNHELQLSPHVDIKTCTEKSQNNPSEFLVLFFRPDGTLWKNNAEDFQYRLIEIATRRRFKFDENDSDSISRTLLIDLTTGAVNITRQKIKPESSNET